MQPTMNQGLVLLAGDEAKRLGHEYVGTEHILLALTHDRGGGGDLLARLALDKHALRARVESIVQWGSSTDSGERPLTQRTQAALKLAHDFALERGDSSVDPAHILIGLLREQRNIAAQVLHDAGATEAKTLAALGL